MDLNKFTQKSLQAVQDCQTSQILHINRMLLVIDYMP